MEQIFVSGMKKANNLSQVEQTIPFGTESFIKTQKEIENVKKEITHNFYFYQIIKNNGIIKTKISKKILENCKNYENNQYFHEYPLYCAINEFLFQVENYYYWYCKCIHAGKKISFVQFVNSMVT